MTSHLPPPGLSALLTALGALAGCAGEPRAPDPRDPGDPAGPPTGDSMHAVVLTPTAPRQELALSPRAPAPTTLILAVAAIDNPTGQAFSLSARVVWGTAAAPPGEEAIGRVTPFPATQAGDFALGVPEPARGALARSDVPVRLRIQLLPIAADRALTEPLRVTLGEPAWR